MQGTRQPINAPPGQQARQGTPWLGLAIVGLLFLLLVVLAAYLLLGIGRDDGGDGSGASGTAGLAVTKVQEGRVLGFPVTATRNTTRIPAGDPVEASLASLLASYPSVGPGTAPKALTVASSEEWQAAAAAAALSAEPVGAPLLLAPSGRLSAEGSELLATLDPQGAPTTGEAQVFAVGKVAPPSGFKVEKVSGDSAAQTAASLAERLSALTGGPPEAFLVLSDEDPAYGAPAAAWAARSGDPILFTGRDSLPAATKKVLTKKANSEVPVFVLGPPSAVSAEVVKEIDKAAATVERLPGDDPTSASLELVRFSSGTFGWNLNDPGHGYTVIRSDRPMDGIAATPLSTGGTWPALLMTDDPDALPEDVLQYLLDVQPGYSTDPTRALYNHVWIIGDESIIGLDQQAEIDRAAELIEVGASDGVTG